MTTPFQKGILIGLNSYILKYDNKQNMILNGKEYDYDSDIAIKIIQYSPCYLLRLGNAGSYHTYILNAEEQLLLETEETVLYADEDYYLVLTEDNTYKICSYN